MIMTMDLYPRSFDDSANAMPNRWRPFRYLDCLLYKHDFLYGRMVGMRLQGRARKVACMCSSS